MILLLLFQDNYYSLGFRELPSIHKQKFPIVENQGALRLFFFHSSSDAFVLMPKARTHTANFN